MAHTGRVVGYVPQPSYDGQIEPTKLLRLRVIGGSGLAKKDIFGARYTGGPHLYSTFFSGFHIFIEPLFIMFHLPAIVTAGGTMAQLKANENVED